MPKRVAVTLKPEARASLVSLAETLEKRVDMRIGLSMPRQGVIVGEVAGQVEVDRIAGMAEIEGVRIQAALDAPRTRRAGRGMAASG